MESDAFPTPTAAAETKAALRAELHARRRRVPERERERASERVAGKVVQALDWEQARSLHAYAAVPAWGELDTSAIVAAARELSPGIEVVFPSLRAVQPLPERPFDVVIVPVLGFDDGNFRLGLGAGFYDRFLAMQPKAKKIGLAYRWAALGDRLPHEPHDIPLDMVVTDA